MSLDAIRTTYSILLGYWDNFFRDLHPRAKVNELSRREFEQLMYKPGKTAMPIPESEPPKKYTPSEREIQCNNDLIKRILDEQKAKNR